MKKGRFITLEGGEGVGKSTLIKALDVALKKRGYSLFTTHQPGATSLGQKLRELLLDQSEIKLCSRAELLLFLADKSQHIAQILLPAINEHDFVICDRYIDSAIAYQGDHFKDSYKQFLQVCTFAVQELTPDLTFILDMDPSIGRERILERSGGKLDTIEQKEHAYHERVRSAFLALAAKSPERYAVVDAANSPEETKKTALKVLEERGWI